MIAMAILAVMATISSFSWNRYVTNSNLRTATRELEADIFLIKERAVSERIHYRITLNVGANSYTIDQGGAASGDAYTVLQTKNPATLGSGNSLLDTNFANARIIFQPRGTLGSGTGRVRLQNNRNSISTITVNITGRTYVQFAMQ
jgi:Tfp pilus assembly protein FimT